MPAQAQRHSKESSLGEKVEKVLIPAPAVLKCAMHEQHRMRMLVTSLAFSDDFQHEPLPSQLFNVNRFKRPKGNHPLGNCRKAGAVVRLPAYCRSERASRGVMPNCFLNASSSETIRPTS